MDQGTSVRSFIDREREIVFARLNVEALYQSYLEHATHWKVRPEDAALACVRPFLAGVTLHLSLSPPDEFTAWTWNQRQPPTNYFFSGDNNDFIVIGRVWEGLRVRTSDTSLLYFESQRPRREPQRSTVEVEGLSVLPLFERYYLHSVQMDVRLFALSDTDFALLQALPQANKSWFQGLTLDTVSEYLEKDHEPIEERLYRFRCRCDHLRIFQILHQAYEGKADELFEGDPEVETACPRCGRKFLITREDFERGPRGVGVA